jgi:hypothetical protein
MDTPVQGCSDRPGVAEVLLVLRASGIQGIKGVRKSPGFEIVDTGHQTLNKSTRNKQKQNRK